jgi:hypothetical protein
MTFLSRLLYILLVLLGGCSPEVDSQGKLGAAAPSAASDMFVVPSVTGSMILDGELVSFLSVLEDRFCHIPQDVVVPGILEIADLSDLVESLAPRPVLLQELVSGLNKRVSLFDMEREYGAATSRLVLREQRGDSSLTHWLSQKCQTN